MFFDVQRTPTFGIPRERSCSRISARAAMKVACVALNALRQAIDGFALLDPTSPARQPCAPPARELDGMLGRMAKDHSRRLCQLTDHRDSLAPDTR